MLRTTDVGWKVALWQILTSKASPNCAAAVVEHNGCVEESGAHGGRLVEAYLLTALVDARAAAGGRGLRREIGELRAERGVSSRQ